MNTFSYIPFECVSPIILEDKENHPGYPFFSGTGFFVEFPPFDEIFFITAKHCIVKRGKISGEIALPYDPNQSGNEAIRFKEIIGTDLIENPNAEDVLIYVVGDIPADKRGILKARALQLQHQDDVTSMLDTLLSHKGKVRTVGFPSISKELDWSTATGFAQPRGFHGTLTGPGSIENTYLVTELNWSEHELEGFSGSPILELVPTVEGKIMPVPIGLVLTGKGNQAQFLNINVATDLIAAYLVKMHEK